MLFLVIKTMASILLTVFPWCFWKLLHLPKVGWISSVSIKSKAGITVELATAFEVIALNFWCILNSQFPSSKTVLFCICHNACKKQPSGFAMWRVYYPNEFASPTPPAPFPPPNQPPQAESCWLLHYFLFQESSILSDTSNNQGSVLADLTLVTRIIHCQFPNANSPTAKPLENRDMCGK